MAPRRKIIAYLAISADGYIARPDGDVEWLNRLPKGNDYGMKTFYAGIDTILWGRGTYDWLLRYYRKLGKTTGIFDTSRKNYIFSTKPPKQPADGVEFVKGPVKAFAQRLRKRPGKHIWMMGGAGLLASFMDVGEIDEVEMHVIPVFIGKGIPLMTPRHRDVALKLLATKRYSDGVARLRYAVRRAVGGKKRRA